MFQLSGTFIWTGRCIYYRTQFLKFLFEYKSRKKIPRLVEKNFEAYFQIVLFLFVLFCTEQKIKNQTYDQSWMGEGLTGPYPSLLNC